MESRDDGDDDDDNKEQEEEDDDDDNDDIHSPEIGPIYIIYLLTYSRVQVLRKTSTITSQ